ncbi:MAG: S-layer homology domain-containing protein [Desulfotomaculaceae bacterium]|nr:S-layer homology domain-containing protein [Desulfotomaculaceae bacterium]
MKRGYKWLLVSVALLLLCFSISGNGITLANNLVQDADYHLTLATDKTEYIRGEDNDVKISGTLMEGSSPVHSSFIGLVLQEDDAEPIYFEQVQSDATGYFEWNIPLDALANGNYSVTATANAVNETAEFNVAQHDKEFTLTVSSSKQAYNTGEDVIITGYLLRNDEDNTPVKNISIGLVLSKGEIPVVFNQQVTDINGAFTWTISGANLEQGDYTIMATANAAFGAAVFSVNSGGVVDNIPPEVLSSSPADGESNVPVGKTINIVFSEEILVGSTINDITLKDSSNNLVQFTTLINGTLMKIDPNKSLKNSVVYAVYIPDRAIKDINGNELQSPYTISFTTAESGGGGGGGGGGSDCGCEGNSSGTSNAGLAVKQLSPTSDAGDVDLGVKISVNFNKNIEPVNLSKVYITDSSGIKEVGVTAAVNGSILEISHNKLKPGTIYTVYVPSATVKSVADGEQNKSIKWIFTTVSVEQTDSIFSDVPAKHWAYSLIKELSQKEIITGYPDGTFKPESNVTRAEFAKMINKAKGLGTLQPERGTFLDVVPGQWFYGYVEAAAGAGLVKGDGGKFRPDDLITRAEIATLLVRAIGKDNLARERSGQKTGFQDDADIAPWARGYIAVSLAEGFIKGYPDNTFKGDSSATRAEACALIARAIEHFGITTEK